MKKIPYGIGNYKLLKKDNYYFIDKTKFIKKIENLGSRYLFFLRPRKFGKSLFLSMLEYYYDILAKDEFEKLFSDTYIGKNPTPLKNSYPILKFDFSGIPVYGAIENIRKSFDTSVRTDIEVFFDKYKGLYPDLEKIKKDVLKGENATDMLNIFIKKLTNSGISYYLLIDEYDNFANNIIAEQDRRTYKDITHGGGFLRSFFAVIKNGTQNLSIDRLFVVGVSPLVLSDVTSGMNIGDNISTMELFHDMVGITTKELNEMMKYYSREMLKKEDVQPLMNIFKEYANNYLFSEKEERLYNTDMVMYILNKYSQDRKIPRVLIDPNIKTDYDRLRFLIIEKGRLNGNFRILEEVLENGETTGTLTDSFALGELIDPEKFRSLLYYLGLVSIKNITLSGRYIYTIPNQTIKELLWEYIRKAIRESASQITIDIDRLRSLFEQFAFYGKWKELIGYLLSEFYRIVSVRDFIWKEEGIKMFFLTYLNITSLYKITSEYDTGSGFTDIYLEKNWVIAREVKYEYIIELKHLKGKNGEDKELVEKARKEGIDQLKRYASSIERRIPEYLKDSSDVKLPILKKILIISSSKKPLIVEEVE